jgi:glucose-6-phosphate 1-dehydrogenase
LGAEQCGKALNERKAEVRIQFHKPPNVLFDDIHNNEIVIRIAPNEALWIKVCPTPPTNPAQTSHSLCNTATS